MIKCQRVRLLVLTTFDLGEINALETVKLGLSAADHRLTLDFIRRNPKFFDLEYCKPLLRIRMLDETHVEGLTFENTDSSPLPAQRRRRTEQLAKGAGFREQVYLSQSGVGCLLTMLDVRATLETDQLIYMTNSLIRRRAKVALSNGTIYEVEERVGLFRDLLKAFVVAPRSDYVRTYSMIHIIDLSDGTLRDATTAGRTVYEKYENEFHALSVRTIERWEDRYPAGSTFTEPNVSLSPVGVLRINTRNTVIYEPPYDEVEVEDLYYPAMVEIRIWDLLAASQLQYVQQTLARYEDDQYDDVSPEFLQSLKRGALRAFNEFEGFYLATSKRTRNLYLAAYQEFHLREIRDALNGKTAQLDSIVDSIRQEGAKERQDEVVTQQRDLLAQSNASLERESADRTLLVFIGLATGISLALAFVASFELGSGWRLAAIAAVIVMYVVIYVIHGIGRMRFTYRIKGGVLLKVDESAVEVAKRLRDRARIYKLSEIGQAYGRVTWSFERSGLTERSTTRAELAFRLAGGSDKFNAYLTIESLVSRNRPGGEVGRSTGSRVEEVLGHLGLGQLEIQAALRQMVE